MKKGFTLLETLVAIAILLIAVVGPMSIIGGSLAQVSTARDQMIAVNLAQEGIEVVRQKRDSNMIDAWGGGGAVWSTGLTAGEYMIDTTATIPLVACTGSCTISQKIIRQNASGWHYQALSGSGGTTTRFSRVMIIADIAGGEKGITSTVTWTAGSTPKSVQVSESIFGINS